jgi:hypothetical protein
LIFNEYPYPKKGKDLENKIIPNARNFVTSYFDGLYDELLIEYETKDLKDFIKVLDWPTFKNRYKKHQKTWINKLVGDLEEIILGKP